MRFVAVYKCPLCGRMLLTSQPQDVPYESLPELCGRVIRNQIFINNPALYQAPMYIVCKCDNGNCGLAQFAGFKKVE